MNVKRVGRFLLDRKLYVIIIIIFATGFAAGFATSQVVLDPTNYLAIIATLITISSSIGSMWKLFSDHRRGMNMPSLEYGKLTSYVRSWKERGGIMKRVIFLLEIKEMKLRGQKVNGCEAFLDIPQASVSHIPLYWQNGNMRTIPIGVKEELQLFALSSFIPNDQSETEKRFLFYTSTEIPGHLDYGSEIAYEEMNPSNEVIIVLQVDQGGSAPPKPYKTTIKQILETELTG